MKGVISLIYIYAFLFCGTLCLIAQFLYDHTTLTAGHITSLFVVLGVLLDSFHLYDHLLKVAGMGAALPITSFGHSLVHGALSQAQKQGYFGLFTGMFELTAAGIVAAIVCAFFVAILFRPKA